MLKHCRKIFMVCILTVITTLSLHAQDYTTRSYIEKHSTSAQRLMRETGVPASVILAVAIHESAYGNSRIAKYLNNHFGIKGKNSSTKIRSAYKGYGSVLDSYRDFVGLLQRRKATKPLFEKHESDDYKAWVKGIARSGYSETGDWTRKVISTIDRYNLEKYDEKINLN
ncbi:hemagglutinin [Sphingobacterium sp. DK4209]|uniref:Hemagglutinin n=2 Tax=Sphingobacterium zhuxiongii TaxID=2662364 RepID=A0A5Q0QFK9_9SPHI|nr:hemagglutinin [Sphingobacterium sp. DK4209]QGA28099.1 hemagglutinin [Sphingobacterium sp. dk4302]